MQQIRCEGDTGPHGQTGAIIGPEPFELEETPAKVQDSEDTAVDPKTDLVN